MSKRVMDNLIDLCCDESDNNNKNDSDSDEVIVIGEANHANSAHHNNNINSAKSLNNKGNINKSSNNNTSISTSNHQNKKAKLDQSETITMMSKLNSKLVPSCASFASSKSISTSKRLKTSSSTTSSKQYKIFCDLDGVLVDFESSALKLFSSSLFASGVKDTSSIPSHIFWSRINSTKHFFKNLSWTNDGLDLWKTLVFYYCASGDAVASCDSHHDHKQYPLFKSLSILTGCPRSQTAKFEKFEWCQRHLPLDNTVINDTNIKLKLVHVDKAAKKSMHQIVHHHHHHTTTTTKGMTTISSMFQQTQKLKHSQPQKQSSTNNAEETLVTQTKKVDIITCWSKNKHCESNTNHVLIDDRISLKEDWVKKGGIFIHHVNTIDTLRQMVDLGIIPDQNVV